MLQKILILLSFITLTGCSYLAKINEMAVLPFNASEKTIQTVTISNIWTTDTGSKRNPRSAVLQPAYDGNSTFYTIDTKGLVSSIDVKTGDLNWSRSLSLNVTSGLGLHNDYLYFGTFDGKLYGYKISRLYKPSGMMSYFDIGTMVKSSYIEPDLLIQLTSELSAPVSGNLDKIFAKKTDGDTLAIDYASSTITWQHKGKNIALNIKGSGSIISDFNNIFVPKDDGTMLSLVQNSGKLNWTISISPRSGRNALELLRDVEMTPYLADGVLYVGSFQGSLAAIEAITGNIIWSTPLSVLTDVSVDYDHVYSSSDDGFIYALDKYTGSIKWKTKVSSKNKLTAPIVYNDYILLIDSDGFVIILNKDNGKLLTNYKALKPVEYQSKIFLINKTFYISTKNGKLTAFNIN